MASKKTILILFFIQICLSVYAQEPSLIVQRGHTAPVTDAAISYKNNLLATTSYDKTIKIWDLKSGKELYTFSDLGIGFSPVKLVFSFDETKLFAIISSNNILAFDLNNFDKIKFLESSGTASIPLYAVSHPNRDEIGLTYEDGVLLAKDLTNHKGKSGSFFIENIETEITKIEYSNDGRYCFSVNEEGKTFVYDEKKGDFIVPFENQKISSFAFHPNNENLVTLQTDSTLSYLQFSKNKVLKSQKIPIVVQHLSWLNDSELLLMDAKYQLHRMNIKTFEMSVIPLFLPRFYTFKSLGNNKILYNQGPMTKIVDVNDLKNHQTFQGYVGNVYNSSIDAILFSPDNRNIITGGGTKTVSFWGEANTQDIELTFAIKKMVLSPNNKFLAVCGESKQWVLIDVAKKNIKNTFLGHQKTIADIQFLNDNEVITASQDKTLAIWNLEEQKQTDILKDHQEFVNCLAVSKNLIASGDMKGQIILWDNNLKQKVSEFSSGEATIYQLLFSKDRKQLLAGKDDGSIDVWDWEKAQIIKTINPFKQPITNLKYINDDIAISSTLTDKETGSPILILNPTDWSIKKFIDTKSEGIYSFDASPNKRFIVSSGMDNLVHLWNAETGEKLLSIYTLGNGEWAIVTPDGLFDASANGMKLMHFVYLFEAIELSQLKTRYYEPDLLQKLLGYNEEPLRNVRSFSEAKLYPKTSLVLTENFFLNALLEPRNGGIGRLSVFINNKEIIEDANPERNTVVNINLNGFRQYLLNDTINTISVKSYNEDNWIHSRMISVDYQNTINARGTTTDTPKPKLKLKKPYQPKLHALIIGTSNYRGEALDLTFADKDAADMAHALRLSGTELFGADNVNIHLLNTKQTDDLRPTKAHIKQTFETLSTEVKADDVFVIYLSGHGVNYGSPDNQFYYLTQSIASEDITDQSIRENYTISSTEFTDYLKKIPANKQIMVLDACSSGSLVNNLLSQSRSVSSSQKRAFDRMKDRAGVFILAGSAANKVSYEASAFGQGLLTYSLLSGMRGGALRENQFVDVMQLFQYAADKVPQLAAVIGGVQRPVIAAPSGTNSFDIGQITDSVRYKIPLEEIKPLIIRSNFQHETLYEDVLDLGDRLDNELAAIAGEGVSSILFLDVKKYPKAYSVKGRYSISNDNLVTLNAKILQDKATKSDIQITGSIDDLDGLMSDLLNKVAEGLNE